MTNRIHIKEISQLWVLLGEDSNGKLYFNYKEFVDIYAFGFDPRDKETSPKLVREIPDDGIVLKGNGQIKDIRTDYGDTLHLNAFTAVSFITDKTRRINSLIIMEREGEIVLYTDYFSASLYRVTSVNKEVINVVECESLLDRIERKKVKHYIIGDNNTYKYRTDGVNIIDTKKLNALTMLAKVYDSKKYIFLDLENLQREIKDDIKILRNYTLDERCITEADRVYDIKLRSGAIIDLAGKSYCFKKTRYFGGSSLIVGADITYDLGENRKYFSKSSLMINASGTAVAYTKNADTANNLIKTYRNYYTSRGIITALYEEKLHTVIVCNKIDGFVDTSNGLIVTDKELEIGAYKNIYYKELKDISEKAGYNLKI